MPFPLPITHSCRKPFESRHRPSPPHSFSHPRRRSISSMISNCTSRNRTATRHDGRKHTCIFRGKDRRWWHAGARTRTRCESKEPPSSMHLDAVAFEDDIEKPPRRRAKANEARHSYILIIMQYESCNYFTHARTRKPDVPIRCDAHSVFLCTNGTHACTPSPSLLTATALPTKCTIIRASSTGPSSCCGTRRWPSSSCRASSSYRTSCAS